MTTLFQTRYVARAHPVVHGRFRMRQRRQPHTPGAGRPTAPTGPGGAGLRHPVDACSGLPCQRRAARHTASNVDRAEHHVERGGTRTYEFQVSDNAGFTLGASLTTSFLVSVNQTGVTEGGDGRTSSRCRRTCSRRRACSGERGPFRARPRRHGRSRRCSGRSSLGTPGRVSCMTR